MQIRLWQLNSQWWRAPLNDISSTSSKLCNKLQSRTHGIFSLSSPLEINGYGGWCKSRDFVFNSATRLHRQQSGYRNVHAHTCRARHHTSARKRLQVRFNPMNCCRAREKYFCERSHSQFLHGAGLSCNTREDGRSLETSAPPIHLSVCSPILYTTRNTQTESASIIQASVTR